MFQLHAKQIFKFPSKLDYAKLSPKMHCLKLRLGNWISSAPKWLPNLLLDLGQAE